MSRNHVLLVVLCIAAAFFISASMTASAIGNNSGENSSVRRGGAVFRERCVGCHNKAPGDTSPFGPPNLYGIFRRKVLNPSQVVTIIRRGNGNMPPFQGVLDQRHIDDLIAYLRAN